MRCWETDKNPAGHCAEAKCVQAPDTTTGMVAHGGPSQRKKSEFYDDNSPSQLSSF
ncbi:hypothetical protein GCM10009720_18250 [Yaniella flava]|uniref:Uncharacterized protein n=1 Tax=Yaniella flava TaxID=287930 RepID=A0ABN2UJ89_9MICC